MRMPVLGVGWMRAPAAQVGTVGFDRRARRVHQANVARAQTGRNGCLLQLLKHAVVELPVGSRFALEDTVLDQPLAQFADPGPLPHHQLPRQLLFPHGRLERILKTAQDIRAPRGYLRFHLRNLPVQTLHGRSCLTINRKRTSPLGLKRGETPQQCLQEFVGEKTRILHRFGLAVESLGGGTRGFRLRQPQIQLGQPLRLHMLLFTHRDKPAAALKLYQPAVGLFGLRPQFQQLLRKPLAGLPGSVKLGAEVVLDEIVSVRIGNPGSQTGVAAVEPNLHHPTVGHGCHAQVVLEPLDQLSLLHPSKRRLSVW